MLNPFIWVRGIIANHLAISTWFYWMMAIALGVWFFVAIFQWRKSGKRFLGVGWQIWFALVLIMSLLLFFFGWPTGAQLVWVTIFEAPIGGMAMYWAIFVIGVIMNLFVLLTLVWPGLADRLFQKKGGGFWIASLFCLCWLGLMIRIFFMGGYNWLVYGNTLWPAVEKTAELNKQVRTIKNTGENMPHNRDELQQLYPSEVNEIIAYGRLCYFYDGDNNNYLILTEFADKWHVYDTEHDQALIQPDNPNYGVFVELCK